MSWATKVSFKDRQKENEHSESTINNINKLLIFNPVESLPTWYTLHLEINFYFLDVKVARCTIPAYIACYPLKVK